MSGSVLKGIIGLEANTGHLYYAEVRYESGKQAEAGPTSVMRRPIQMG